MTDSKYTPQQRAIKLLKRGIASPSEIARIANVSRQLVNYWIASAGGINWRQRREEYLRRIWER